MPRDTGEHNSIADYVREVGGRAWFEVPIAGASHSPRSSPRYIDAVRIAGLTDGECVDFDAAAFDEDLRRSLDEGLDVELIEAKNRLNRPVIGQIIAGGDLFLDRFPKHGPLRLSVLVDERRGDPALQQVCERRGIRVHLRPWRPGGHATADQRE